MSGLVSVAMGFGHVLMRSLYQLLLPAAILWVNTIMSGLLTRHTPAHGEDHSLGIRPLMESVLAGELPYDPRLDPIDEVVAFPRIGEYGEAAS